MGQYAGESEIAWLPHTSRGMTMNRGSVSILKLDIRAMNRISGLPKRLPPDVMTRLLVYSDDLRNTRHNLTRTLRNRVLPM